METLVLQGLAFGLQPFQQVFHTHARTAQELAGALDDTLVKSQAAGNRQRVAAPWQADTQPVGWRKRFDVELDRGIDDTGLLVREGLQFGVVRGRDSRYMAFQEICEYSACEGRTLAWVGTRAQFVEQYQRLQAATLRFACQCFRHLATDIGRFALYFFLDALQYFDDAAHVRGERAQALLDALFIANIGKNFFKDRYF